jgi:hypothetical protein
MRQRIKVTCCSHATPDGKAIMGQEEKLRKKFESGTITTDELRHYAFFTVARKPTTVTVSVFGKRTVISVSEYNEIYKPLGFKAL